MYGIWGELSIYRAFDWGVVDMTWSISQHNEECEAAAFNIAALIQELVATYQVDQRNTVEEVAMLYECFAQEAEKILFGK